MEQSMKSEIDTAFDYMIWALALRGTGNSDYQNEFYEKQARKITKRYESFVEGCN